MKSLTERVNDFRRWWHTGNPDPFRIVRDGEVSNLRADVQVVTRESDDATVIYLGLSNGTYRIDAYWTPADARNFGESLIEAADFAAQREETV